LLNYGFIIDDNDANEYFLTVEFDENYPLFKNEEKSYVKSSIENHKKFRISENILDCQVIDFFSYLRYMLYDENLEILYKMINENYKMIREDSSQGFYLISPLTVKNELRVLKKIQEICLKELSKYQNSLEEDQELIRKEQNNELTLSYNIRNSVIMRISEKKILNFYVILARYCEDLFTKTERVNLLSLLLRKSLIA
jgi:histone-lysine N-methyltransferase SETD3